MQKINLVIILAIFFIGCNNNTNTDNSETVISEETAKTITDNTMESQPTLQSLLAEKKANFNQKASDEKKKLYAEGIDAVAESGILESAMQKGDDAIDFTLTNAQGENIQLSEELKKGPVVLTWYRGGWCPYCNITLHQLQEELPNFTAAGAQLIALTPELPDSSLSTQEKHSLDFHVLSDLQNKVAKEYGIVFELIEGVANAYQNGFGLHEYNGDESNELPLAATYIINTDGKIVYAFLHEDYRERAEPSELTAILNNLYIIL